ncbi:MAG: hypothetical protein HFI34_11465 [Lachnospiraceae bacterium]|nr:hypothetical protein [Lachnospiraceae bacterium]
MNTINKDSLIKLITAGVASFFMLMGVVFNIVIKADGWIWASSVILLLAPLALLAFAVLEISTPNAIRPVYYLIIPTVLALNELINAMHQLVNMGETKFYRASYFSNFILSLVMIAAMVFVIISSLKYKSMFVPFIVSVTYIIYEHFNGIIRYFFLFWGNLFGGHNVAAVFRTFSIDLAMCLSILIVIYMVYKTNKEA